MFLMCQNHALTDAKGLIVDMGQAREENKEAPEPCFSHPRGSRVTLLPPQGLQNHAPLTPGAPESRSSHPRGSRITLLPFKRLQNHTPHTPEAPEPCSSHPRGSRTKLLLPQRLQNHALSTQRLQNHVPPTQRLQNHILPTLEVPEPRSSHPRGVTHCCAQASLGLAFEVADLDQQRSPVSQN